MRIKILILVLILVCCAASVYAVRWYRGFYHHVTHEELSHEVKHSTFAATIRNGQPLDLHIYQQEHANNQPLVLFTSGDGGWSPFCADIAAHIAATGITVVGVDSKSYLVNFASPQKPVSAEQLTRDYDEIARAAFAQPGIDAKTPVVLAGWSLGAGYSVIVASQPEFSLPVSKVVAISLPLYGELAWKPTDAIIYFTHGTPGEKVFDVRQYLKKLKQTPIVFLNATNDKNAPLREAQSLYEVAPGAKSFYAVKAGGHHFEGGEKEFFEDLDRGISLSQIADKSDKKLQEREVASSYHVRVVT
ncbi:MAG TPA: AcvB/VirJ family lysyl-phosphatidylglycerol hydrolase [Pyrinomonadaceae bacterium]|nr:AcvB/VirJ family lysyl-phosphatidylglycerol hydrolase [Pyrinomonadaceae bacterium]